MAGVELKGRLRAENLEMYAGAWVVRNEIPCQWLMARVNRYGTGAVSEGKAVVHVGPFGGHGEGFGSIQVGKGGRSALWNSQFVHGQVVVGGESNGCALKGGGVGAPGKVEVRVVRKVDGCLFRPVHELSFVIDAQDGHVLAILGSALDARGVDDPGLDSAWVTLVTIFAGYGELDTFAALEPLHSGDIACADRLGARPNLLSPTLEAAMKRVGAVIGGEGPGLAIDAVELGTFETIGDSTYGLAEERFVVLNVLILCVEALDDVDTLDLESLDRSPVGDEREWGVGHGLRIHDATFGEQLQFRNSS